MKKIFLPLICACAFLSCTDTEDFSSSDIASSKIEFSDEESTYKKCLREE